MSVVIKNVGPIATGSQNQQNTNQTKSFGDQGTVRVVLRGVEYVWGPNESKTLPEDIGAEADAADARLRIMDTRDGWDRGQARTD
jgi:hypothetical protein